MCESEFKMIDTIHLIGCFFIGFYSVKLTKILFNSYKPNESSFIDTLKWQLFLVLIIANIIWAVIIMLLEISIK